MGERIANFTGEARKNSQPPGRAPEFAAVLMVNPRLRGRGDLGGMSLAEALQVGKEPRTTADLDLPELEAGS